MMALLKVGEKFALSGSNTGVAVDKAKAEFSCLLKFDLFIFIKCLQFYVSTKVDNFFKKCFKLLYFEPQQSKRAHSIGLSSLLIL